MIFFRKLKLYIKHSYRYTKRSIANRYNEWYDTNCFGFYISKVGMCLGLRLFTHLIFNFTLFNRDCVDYKEGYSDESFNNETSFVPFDVMVIKRLWFGTFAFYAARSFYTGFHISYSNAIYGDEKKKALKIQIIILGLYFYYSTEKIPDEDFKHLIEDKEKDILQEIPYQQVPSYQMNFIDLFEDK